MGVGQFSSMMKQTVTIEAAMGPDNYGQQTLAAGVVYQARVINKLVLVKDNTGREVMSKHQVWLAENPTVTVNDRITLPDLTTPPILSVETYPDDKDDPHHTKIFLG